MSERSLAEAIELLDRAIALSPAYAQALAYAALCRAMRPLLAYSVDEGRDFREATNCRDAHLIATLPIRLPSVIAAFIGVLLDRDYQTAWDLVDRSLAINPNDSVTWTTRGWISTWAGDSETALREFENALRLSPLDPHWTGSPKYGMASALYFGGRPEEALPWARKAMQERPRLERGAPFAHCRAVAVGSARRGERGRQEVPRDVPGVSPSATPERSARFEVRPDTNGTLTPCARPACQNNDWNTVPEPQGRYRSTRSSLSFNAVGFVLKIENGNLAASSDFWCVSSGHQRLITNTDDGRAEKSGRNIGLQIPY